MKTYTREELTEIIVKHAKWRRGEEGGERADLSGADLRGADLSGAYLRGADLSRAYLRGADLSGADLRGADLSGAYLRGAYLSRADLSGADLSGAYLSRADLSGADLSGAYLSRADLSGADLSGAYLSRADLSGAYEDFMSKLALQKDEVIGLYQAIVDGRIDGSTYEGECACFVGTLAKVKACHYTSLKVKAESESATERLFLAIRKGDTPANNPISEIVACWTAEFMFENGMDIPQREVVWS